MKRNKKTTDKGNESIMETETLVEESASVPTEGSAVVALKCNAPAPLVVNGAAYVGCQLEQDHEDDHQVQVTWRG